jgi:hypothetical protein
LRTTPGCGALTTAFPSKSCNTIPVLS